MAIAIATRIGFAFGGNCQPRDTAESALAVVWVLTTFSSQMVERDGFGDYLPEPITIFD